MSATKKRTHMKLAILCLTLTCLAGPVLANGSEAAEKMQKNGMWEIRANNGKPRLYCVTEQEKFGSNKSVERDSDGMCKVVRDTLSGDRLEVQMQCEDRKEGATLLVTQISTVTPVEIRSTATVKLTGNSPTLQAMAQFLGETNTGHLRWIRPCKTGEKAGFQKQ